MSIDLQALRIDGIYRQNDKNDLMLRVKIPGGLLSPPQADTLAALSERYTNGLLHLTTRGSIELHGLRPEMIEAVGRSLAAVGLTSRGACGGAVRGVACSTIAAPGFTVAQALARRLHRHFTGNPHFEGLPKKFKISVDAGYSGARHLIQDAGIVHVGTTAEGHDLFDLWVAGGLGREPQPAFLFATQIEEGELLATLEAIIRLYCQRAAAGKRLKHLLRELGEGTFRELVDGIAGTVVLQPSRGIGFSLQVEEEAACIEARIFAGQLSSHDLRAFADLARRFGNEQLMVTADQNLLFYPADLSAGKLLRQELVALGFAGARRDEQVNFRICPGNHECRMGLAPTRLVARKILDVLPAPATGLILAISGCPNSCSQPQLADIGIITTALRSSGEGERQPHFSLYRRQGEGFGTVIAADLMEEELLVQLSRIA